MSDKDRRSDGDIRLKPAVRKLWALYERVPEHRVEPNHPDSEIEVIELVADAKARAEGARLPTDVRSEVRDVQPGAKFEWAERERKPVASPETSRARLVKRDVERFHLPASGREIRVDIVLLGERTSQVQVGEPLSRSRSRDNQARQDCRQHQQRPCPPEPHHDYSGASIEHRGLLLRECRRSASTHCPTNTRLIPDIPRGGQAYSRRVFAPGDPVTVGRSDSTHGISPLVEAGMPALTPPNWPETALECGWSAKWRR